ncbi:MAG: lysophospholipid acyltransferase family protein [Bacillota bacterium]|nr:lysophospholipid acyltransferase family protein [Bacillota bacterium]
MIRTIIWFAYFWLILIVYMPFLWFAQRIENVDERAAYADRKARYWAEHLLALAGAHVTVTGSEKIPENGAVVYVANHQSNFDIPLMIAFTPKPKGFIAKVEILKMPMIRSWMQHMRCVFIDRDNIRQQVKAISEGVATLKSGHSMIIFPEGTRSKDGTIGEFKAGSLKLATKSGATIVPVAIHNSIGLMQKGSFIIHPSEIKMIICDPIEITAEMNKDTHGLAESIRTMIEKEIQNI